MMNQTAETATLSDFLAVLRERRVLVIGTTLVCIAAAIAYAVLKEPTYQATATVSIEDPTKQPGALIGQPQSDFFPGDDVAAGAEIVTSTAVVRAVSQQPGIDRSEDELRGIVSTEVQPTSNLLEITVTDSDREATAAIANEFAQQTRVVTRRDARTFFEDAAAALGNDPAANSIRVRLESLAAVADPVQVFRDAEVPDNPVSPRPLRDGIIAAILGLLLGIGLAFLRKALDRRFSGAAQVQRELQLPVVGHVRSETLGLRGGSQNGRAPVSEEELEAFRILRTNVDFLADTEAGSVMVTSPLAEEGKSTVALWYAYANAVAGRRTVLVECDFRRPVLAERFNLAERPGLGEFLTGEVRPKDVLRSVALEGPTATATLPLIPAGFGTRQPGELIHSERFRGFLAQIKRAYDLVVVDSAPLLPVSDSLELVPQMDAVLLCIRLHQTTREQAQSAKEAIERLPERPTGLVVTGISRGGDDDYYGYYYAPPEDEAVSDEAIP